MRLAHRAAAAKRLDTARRELRAEGAGTCWSRPAGTRWSASTHPGLGPSEAAVRGWSDQKGPSGDPH